MNPKISVIICTYNSENMIKNLLYSVMSQSYQNFEIILVDGGSTDKTLEKIREYTSNDKRISLVHNKKRFPEGKGFGKSQAFDLAKGDIILFIDQDNVLQSPEVFQTAVSIFKKDKNALGILAGLKSDYSDSKIVRYVSLTGTDSFFAYRSIDFIRNLNNLREEIINNNSIETINLKENNLYLTGGNCFFYSSKSLKNIGGYTQDVLVIKKLINVSKDKLYIIKNATKHYAESSLFNLIKKKFFWANKFKNQKKEKFNYFPNTKEEIISFLRNLFFNMIIIPNFYYSFKILKRKRDSIILIFPIMAFLNTIAYLSNFILSKLSYKQ